MLKLQMIQTISKYSVFQCSKVKIVLREDVDWWVSRESTRGPKEQVGVISLPCWGFVVHMVFIRKYHWVIISAFAPLKKRHGGASRWAVEAAAVSSDGTLPRHLISITEKDGSSHVRTRGRAYIIQDCSLHELCSWDVILFLSDRAGERYSTDSEEHGHSDDLDQILCLFASMKVQTQQEHVLISLYFIYI